ncbi:MAG TPA: hypothetical protein VLE99_04470 [Candidatus Saccharimonadales bacterium]|nr:hypothetical protein [Candidatus Saccharimonadales bacterium]
MIGLSVTNPWLALPLAFLSHFACDLVPHYDLPDHKTNMAKLLGSRAFLWQYIMVPGGLCVLLVALLALTRPQHWLQAAVCAFLAASPDLFWLPRFLHVKRTGKDLPPTGWFLKLHEAAQWKTAPKFWTVEALWFVTFAGLTGMHL